VGQSRRCRKIVTVVKIAKAGMRVRISLRIDGTASTHRDRQTILISVNSHNTQSGSARRCRRCRFKSALQQILLQKSFCIDHHKLSEPYAGRSNNHLRGYIICDELTGGLGNALKVTSVGDCGSVRLFAGN
jgi:hypothetical protein